MKHMKKIIVLLIALALVPAFFLMTGCGGSQGEVLIQERFFLMHVNNIRANLDRYEGRTVRYEGMFFSVGGQHYVLRYTEDCCGEEHMTDFEMPVVGFAVHLGDNIAPVEDNTWVEVVGVIQRFADARNEPVVVVTSLETRSERGQELVRQ